MYVSESRLVKESCGHESFKEATESSNNLITRLRHSRACESTRSLTITTETTTQKGYHSIKAREKEGDEDIGVGGLKLNI